MSDNKNSDLLEFTFNTSVKLNENFLLCAVGLIIAFIVLKLTNTIDWSWWWILSGLLV